MSARRLATIGAGPIGLAAGVLAARRGWDVTVLEQGAVGDTLRAWGPTRLFTPLEMNVPAELRASLHHAPPGDALLTGPQMARDVLEPIAALPELAGRVLTGHRVVAIARAGLARHEFAGHPLRAERPFRLLVDSPKGERILEAEAVLDASGMCGPPVWAGSGGLPAAGERSAGPRILRRLGDLHGAVDAIRGRRALLVGSGHSAANAVVWLASVAAESERTSLTWAVRTAHARPVPEIADDPLPERRRIAAAANALAQSPPGFLALRRRAAVASIVATAERLEVTFTASGVAEPFDLVAVFAGQRPDASMLSELAVEIAPVTEGSARLARALSGVTDCLACPSVSAADLASGEPGFHMIGARSYGRSRAFLLRTGIDHLRTILDSLETERAA